MELKTEYFLKKGSRWLDQRESVGEIELIVVGAFITFVIASTVDTYAFVSRIYCNYGNH